MSATHGVDHLGVREFRLIQENEVTRFERSRKLIVYFNQQTKASQNSQTLEPDILH